MFRVIRPSSLDRIVRCPGSLGASDTAPKWVDEYDDTIARDEGTACHWLSERVILDDEIVTVGDKAPNGVALTTEMFDAAFLYKSVIDAWGVAFNIERPTAVPQLPYTHGTPDADGWCAKTRTVYLADLKFGHRTIEVWPNWQLLPYMLGIADSLGQDYRTVTFNVTIVQPRKFHKDGVVRTAIIRGDSPELAVMIEAARQAIAEALSATPRLFPGKQCMHCPGRGRCAALRSQVADGIYVDAHDLTLSQAENELAYLERQASLLDAYISGLRVQVEHAIRNGALSTKYELRKSAGRLAWAPDSANNVRTLAKLMGVNVDKPSELITPTQAIKLMGPETVNIFARRSAGALELAPVDIEITKRKFEK